MGVCLISYNSLCIKPQAAIASISCLDVLFLSLSFLFSTSVQALISRDYRGDVDRNVIDKFLPLVMEAEEEGTVSPIVVHNKVTFVYIKHNNVYSIQSFTEFCVEF